ELHALVGYGAMLMEGFVGVIALIAASLLAPGDYFAINTTLSAEALGALGYPVAHIQELSRIVEQDIMGRPGGAVSLAVGMASIFSALRGLGVGTTVLIKMDKAPYLCVAAVARVFVGVITLSGSYELFVLFMTKAAAAAIREAAVFYLDAALVGIVAALAVVILVDSVSKWYGLVIQKKPFTTSEVTGGESGVKMPAGPCC